MTPGTRRVTELVLVALIAALATWTLRSVSASPVEPAAPRPAVGLPFDDAVTMAQMQDLAKRFGPSHFSEHPEEWIARDFFADRRGGVFVDIGANHYKNGSNTYFLEQGLGWSGLAVEPQAQFAADYAKFRPRTRFLSFFVGEKSNEKATLYVLSQNSLVASESQAFTAHYGAQPKGVEVQTITLDDLLSAAKLPHVDFLSIDVELAEPKVLAGFDIERHKPTLVCIEAHPQVRQQILDYFTQHRYVLEGKYLRVDNRNFYFRALEGPAK